MSARVLLTVQLALLVVTLGAKLEDKKVKLWKCCTIHQMLSVNAESCVKANWPGNASIQRDEKQYIVPPLDREWVRRWLPPGLPLQNIRSVFCDTFLLSALVSFVNASSFWDRVLLQGEDLSKNPTPFFGNYIARPKPGGGFRKASFCVDATPMPLGPYAMRFKTICSKEECAYKCCGYGDVLKNDKGQWNCKHGYEHVWTPDNSSLTAFDSEFPYRSHYMCENFHPLPFEQQYAEWARHTGGIHHFHFSTWHTCFDFYHRGNNSLDEGLFRCEYPRITRGAYWLFRPLCFLSALLLTMSLVSVARDKKMRRNNHGRFLASHGACLLAFNVGQAVYYIAMSDHLDEEGKEEIPVDFQLLCKYFALSMYFVLTSAWFWLTALCANMASGFRLKMPRRNKGNGKKFLAISAFAWGLPAVLTITCSILFTQPKLRETPAWYTPSLMETRTCYIEPLFFRKSPFVEVPFMKSGTALFYYGPVFCLVLYNVISLALTLRNIQYLKKGNSVLHQKEDQFTPGQRYTEGNSPPTTYTATGNEQSPQGRNRRSTTVDTKTIKLYIKMVLISGGIELLIEVIMWFITHGNLGYIMGAKPKYYYPRKDRDLAYRAAGYVTDFFRAAVVTWLAAPEGGYFGLIKGMLHRDRQKKSAGAGNAGRRKQNVA